MPFISLIAIIAIIAILQLLQLLQYIFNYVYFSTLITFSITIAIFSQYSAHILSYIAC